MTLLLTVALGVVGQEICDNGIDDDANGLIDLNDDQCDCGEVLPLLGELGALCENLRLIAAQAGGNTFQWYLDGVAIIGETSNIIDLGPMSPDGTYICVVTSSSGCYETEPFLKVLPDIEYIDYGTVYICPDECHEVDGYVLCTPGEFNWDGRFEGSECPYNANIIIAAANPSEATISAAVCSGQTYVLNDIMATTTGVYQTVIDNVFGCDSTITVNLTVEPEIPVNINAEICPGDTYTYLDITATEAGEYTTLIDGGGECDTLVTLNVSLLAPATGSMDTSICVGTVLEIYDIVASETGAYETTLTGTNGCDSILTVNLTVYGPLTSELDTSICAGAEFVFYDITATETGSYNTTISTANGCDSLITVMLTVDDPIEEVVDMTFCENEIFVYYDITTTQPGQYETVFTAENGCDSTVIVNLEMLNVSNTLLTEYICEGSAYQLYDIYATESGIYTHTLTNAVGCDSIITVDLTVNDTVIVNYIEEICNGDTLTIRDTEYTMAGMYDIVITDDFGCDTLINIDVTVLEPSYATINEVICEGETFTYGDIETDAAGTYEAVLVNAVGCDSIVTVNLEVNLPSESTFTEEICEGETFSFYDITTDEAGSYEVVIENAAGCDSTITVDLVVNPLLTREVEITLCEGEIYTGYGLDADETDIYEVRFANAEGCDSIVTIDLLINSPENLLELGPDMEIDLGETVDVIPEFIAEDLIDLVWYDENGNQLGFDRELNDYKPLVDTRIYLSGSDSNGCDVVDEIFIRVELNVEIYIPNVFSPNADGTNDEFLFKYNEGIVGIQEVLIFDRWGEHIYTADAPFASEAYMGWDGTYKGSKVNPGVYVYTIIANVIDGSTRTFAGDVTVVR